MSDEKHGSLFGIPYDFRKPSLRRLLGSYWQPGEGMIVRKPFGIGYSLNLANWRSWVALAVTALLLLSERSRDPATDEAEEIVIEE